MKQPSWTVAISGLLTALFYILVVDSNGQTAYPLHRTGNNRYLTDQTGKPVMLVGDSAWNLIVNLNTSDASQYFANRKARGFNAVMTAVLCGPGLSAGQTSAPTTRYRTVHYPRRHLNAQSGLLRPSGPDGQPGCQLRHHAATQSN